MTFPPAAGPQSWHPPQPPPGWVQPRNTLALAGFVCGLSGAVLACIPIVGLLGWPVAIVGIVLAALGLQRAPMSGRRGRAVAGVILGVIAVPLLLINTWLTVDTIGSDSTSTTAAAVSTSSSAPTYAASADGGSSGRPLQDRVFLETLRKSGIQFASETDAAVSARMQCEMLDGGMSPLRVLSGIQTGGNWSRDQAGAILGAAIGAYCPRYLPLLEN